MPRIFKLSVRVGAIQALASMAIGEVISRSSAHWPVSERDIPGAALIDNAFRVSAIAVGSHAEHHAMTQFLIERQIKPVIDSAFDLEAAEDASCTRRRRRVRQSEHPALTLTAAP